MWSQLLSSSCGFGEADDASLFVQSWESRGRVLSNEFLSNVESFNQEYSSIRINSQLETITLPFWSMEQINSGLMLREEWGVPLNLIPFQGDWHELLCLDRETGKVVYLTDDREVVFSWSDTEEFIASLCKEEMDSDENSGITVTRIAPGLLDKLNKYKQNK